MKTKKTILENDQLGKELGYHIRQTDLLLQKNEKLVQENVELHRQVLLAKEVEAELARRNLMNQKTIRILLYKFQGIHVDKSGEKALVSEQADDCKDKELEQIKRFVQEQTRVIDSMSGAEEAMRFLYACLDDVEVENVVGTQVQADYHPEADSRMNFEGGPSGHPASLNQLTPLQRQELLINLLRTAISLRAVAQNPANQRAHGGVLSTSSLSAEGRGEVSVEDILNLSVEGVQFVDEFHHTSRQTQKLVSIGVQTQAMNLEERLALDIKERLRPCSLFEVAT